MPVVDVRDLLLRCGILWVCAWFCIACSQGVEVFLETPAGKLRGTTFEGVERYLGIPYAKPPVGELRWQPPVLIESWEGTMDATEFGPWCSQFDFERRDEGDVYAGEGWTIFRGVPPNESSSEDCLSLNVWAPKERTTQKPVMVFLHGNALGSSFPIYDGESFARQGIVYVSINFRLHTMGIFAHPALTESADAKAPLGRYSELDRLAALRWVKNNIAAFGGDPNRITLAGNSEGGAATLQLLTNKASEGLFHQAIVQSGNGWWNPVTHDAHEQIGCLLASLSGLDGCNATVEELRALPWPKLPATGPYTIDGRHWLKGATQAIEDGEFLDVPLLIGWNDFDGSSLRYSPQQVIDHTHPAVVAEYDATQPDGGLAYALYTDLHSGAPARWVAREMQDGHPVYVYLFSYVVSWDREEVHGAQHGYELPHAFNSWDKQLNPLLRFFILNDDDKKMTQIMHGCWVSFVKTGRPSCPGAPDWPRYHRESDQLMELNDPPKILQGYRASQLDAQETHKQHYFEQVRKSVKQLVDEGV